MRRHATTAVIELLILRLHRLKLQPRGSQPTSNNMAAAGRVWLKDSVWALAVPWKRLTCIDMPMRPWPGRRWRPGAAGT